MHTSDCDANASFTSISSMSSSVSPAFASAARLLKEFSHTERELGQARQGFQNLAARLWYLERAFSELHATAARVAMFASARMNVGATLSDSMRWNSIPTASACSRAPTSTS